MMDGMQKAAVQQPIFREPELHYDPEAVRAMQEAKARELTMTQKAIATVLGIGAPALMAKVVDDNTPEDDDVVEGNLKMYGDMLTDEELLSYMLSQPDDDADE